MKRILGSPYEMSLRVLLMLAEAHEQSLTLDKIAVLDFMAVYASDYGLSETNLHGFSRYRFGEFSGRRELVRNGIKQLVLNGSVDVLPTDNGYEYVISESGLGFISNMKCDYACTYRKLISEVLMSVEDKSDQALFGVVSQRTINSLREG